MSIYYNNQIPGNLFLRNLQGDTESASTLLSSIYLKYYDVNLNFFNQLTNNQITRFDIFHDCVFLETFEGYIFEKFYIDDYGHIQPYNLLNMFNFRKNTTVDYWYDDQKNKIYYTELAYFDDPNQIHGEDFWFTTIIFFKSFDCNTGNSKLLFLNAIKLTYNNATNWSDYNFIIENPKLTYNKDTKLFNVTYGLRNAANTLGLISLNILNQEKPYITEINGFLPFFDINYDTSIVYPFVPIPLFDNFITTETLPLSANGELIDTERGEDIMYEFDSSFYIKV
jgi:hypothetical protein